jgi:hypothetical protein
MGPVVSNKSRRKGAVAERAIVDLLQDAGLAAKKISAMYKRGADLSVPLLSKDLAVEVKIRRVNSTNGSRVPTSSSSALIAATPSSFYRSRLLLKSPRQRSAADELYRNLPQANPCGADRRYSNPTRSRS